MSYKPNLKTAVLVDGGFYRKRASFIWGKKTAGERANELQQYCSKHITGFRNENRQLYRIFYYDCPPLAKTVYHPLLKSNVNFGKSETYRWTLAFFDELKRKRKFALRLGLLSDEYAGFNIRQEKLKQLLKGSITIDDLCEEDFNVTFEQKGVDMRIGIDIASLAYKKQVNQIILISGDSDFVPAAKLARREGIDFILDPMGSQIKPDLFEHIDGIQSKTKSNKFVKNSEDKKITQA